MTDKELLELAYKALMSGADLNDDKDMLKRWNPLTDDGDALRLAVKLEMNIENAYDFIEIAIYDLHLESSDIRVSEDLRKDPYTATRRAIVRAAAEIGKAM